jgi:putative membrane protein
VAYNLESFELFVVSIPRTRRVVGYILGVSVFAGLLTAVALQFGTALGWTVELSVLGETAVPRALVLVAAFAVAALAGGEATQLLVPAYPRNWGYYLALVCLVLAGVLVPVGVVLGGATDSAAAPVWFALGTAFLFSFQALVVSDDIPGVWRQGPASAVQPAVLFAGLTVVTPLSLSLSAHAPEITVLVGVGVGLVLVSGFVELLMRGNVPEVRTFEITSNLVQRTPLHLDMGFSMDRPVQTFAVETAGGRTRITTPWVHPGILEGIGGARLTPNVLAALNGQADRHPDGSEDNIPWSNSSTGDSPGGDSTGSVSTDGGDGERGFFWHVPCTHLSDSPDPYVHEPVLDGVGDPETTGEASRLVSRTYDETTFHGRRYGDTRVVFFESDEFADIEVDIFGEVIDPERTLVVDRHVRAEETGRGEVHVDSPETERLRGYLREFLSVLDEQPLAEYRAGDARDLDIDGISLYALVEVVDGQRTAYVVADRNERPHAMAKARKQLTEEFDEVLLFTTDTHASVTENRFDPQTRPNQIRDLVETAAAAVTDAAAGLTAEYTEVELMREDYQRLIFSLNILARVYIVSLAGLYLLLGVGLALA